MELQFHRPGRLQQAGGGGSGDGGSGDGVGGVGGHVDKDDAKDGTDDVWNYLEAQAAFLGPSLWNNGDLKVCRRRRRRRSTERVISEAVAFFFGCMILLCFVLFFYSARYHRQL